MKLGCRHPVLFLWCMMTKLYLSDLLENPIYSHTGERIGRLHDMVVADIDRKAPRIQGLLMRRGRGKQDAFIPEHDIANINPKEIKLSTDIVDLTPFERREDEVLLLDEVLDKQIVDIDDRRLARVNDLEIRQEQEILTLAGVDVSSTPILNRIGLGLLSKLVRRNIVPWEEAQFLGGSSPVKLNLKYKNLETLHPVDIARIIFEGPGYKRKASVITSVRESLAADIIEELQPEMQKKLLSEIPFQDTVDIVAQMESDKAADLLLVIGSEMQEKILTALHHDQAEQLRSLLQYPEYCAGAYMNTEFLAIPSNITVAEALSMIHELPELPEFSIYTYILESMSKNRLVGIVSSDELLKANPRSRISAIMVRHFVTAKPTDHIKEILKTMYGYSLSAVPIIGKNNRIMGIVTFHDAATFYLPKSWKHKLTNSRYF